MKDLFKNKTFIFFVIIVLLLIITTITLLIVKNKDVLKSNNFNNTLNVKELFYSE